MRHKTLVPALILSVCAAFGATSPAAAQRGGDDSCDCRELASQLNGLEVTIDDLETTLDSYEEQLAIPGKVASALSSEGVRATGGGCKPSEGGMALGGGARLCYPLADSNSIVPRITDRLERLGYDEDLMDEAAATLGVVQGALETARKQRHEVLSECIRCGCACT